MKNGNFDSSYINDLFIDYPEPYVVIYEGRILKCNNAVLELLGYHHRNQMIGMQYDKLFKDATPLDYYIEKNGTMESVSHQLEVLTKENKVIACLVHMTQKGRQTICIFKPLSNKLPIEYRLNIFCEILENNTEGVLIMNASSKILWVNEAFQNLTGYSKEEVLDEDFSRFFQMNFDEIKEQIIVHKKKLKKELSIGRKKGEYVDVLVNFIYIRHKMGDTFALICKDISESKKKEQQIYELAYRDSLTSLYNRNFFMNRIQEEIKRAKEKDQKLAVLFFDLDNFKSINDTLGHRIGDFVLKLFALSLKETVREADVVARIGGDEFVCLLPSIKNEGDIQVVTERIMKKFAEPIVIDENEFYITSSIGIAMFPDDTEDSDELMHNADIAMYKAKKDKEKKVIRFKKEMKEDLDEHFKISNHLRKAIEKNELSIHYQPIVNIKTGELMSAEALLRWKHSIYGYIPPSKFIPIAETNGLILDIGTWVLEEACRQNVIWQKQGFKKIPIAVNISMKQLEDDGFIQKVIHILDKTGLEPEYLELEITESISMNHVEKVISVLEALHRYNIKISIDDFGTGYSSLGKLRKLSINKLKIDRSFINDLNNGQETKIVSAIIALANNLGLHIVAEGIETKEQLDFLQTKECHYGQGYLFSRPLNQMNFEKMLIENAG